MRGAGKTMMGAGKMQRPGLLAEWLGSTCCRGAASFPLPSLSFPLPSLSFPLPSLSFPLPSLSFPLPSLSFPLPSLSFPRKRESSGRHPYRMVPTRRLTLNPTGRIEYLFTASSGKMILSDVKQVSDWRSLEHPAEWMRH